MADDTDTTVAQTPPAFALASLKRIVEAALLAASHPLTLPQLYALFPDDQPAPSGGIEQALDALRADCAERGIELIEVASGFRFQVRADVHPWITRLWSERQTRYTRATLETLSLIAYRQPITRGEIEQIRGVAVNTNIIRMLEEREWIRVIGHRDVPGKPALFGTTKTFLDYFNLSSLDQLPPLAELREIADFDPQLQFDGAGTDDTRSTPAIAAVAMPDATADADGESNPSVADDHAGTPQRAITAIASGHSGTDQVDADQADPDQAGTGPADPETTATHNKAAGDTARSEHN